MRRMAPRLGPSRSCMKCSERSYHGFFVSRAELGRFPLISGELGRGRLTWAVLGREVGAPGGRTRTTAALAAALAAARACAADFGLAREIAPPGTSGTRTTSNCSSNSSLLSS
eukprot:scaffold92699_cov60-Phaeocystis_antarctica.AAC.2